MTDQIVDDRAAFREAMARAEAKSGIERDPNTGEELNGIEAIVSGKTPDVVLPELAGAVPVSASDQPITPGEPAPADTSQEQQPVAAEAATPTVEELIAEREQLRAQVEEQKAMIGRQSTEVGQTREQMARIEAEIAALKAAAATPVAPVAPVVPITQDLIDSNPALATQAAFEQKNEAALAAAWNAWEAEDEGAARQWLTERRYEQREAALRAEIEATRSELQQLKEPLQAQAQETADQRQWKDAFDKVRASHPDVFQVDANGQSIAEKLILAAGEKPEYDAYKTMLQTGDASTKAAALSALYALETLGDPEGMKKQLEQAAQEAEAEAAAARAAAAGVTSQVTAGQPAEPKTIEELEAEAYISRQKGKPSLASGWTGRG